MNTIELLKLIRTLCKCGLHEAIDIAYITQIQQEKHVDKLVKLRKLADTDRVQLLETIIKEKTWQQP